MLAIEVLNRSQNDGLLGDSKFLKYPDEFRTGLGQAYSECLGDENYEYVCNREEIFVAKFITEVPHGHSDVEISSDGESSTEGDIESKSDSKAESSIKSDTRVSTD